MSALGHYLEAEGLPTASISLVRLHTEKMAPPRALWVPFELGRPLGAPGDVAFQTRVLNATLALFAAPNGPVLEDFADDAPDAADVEGWACPIALPEPEQENTMARRLGNEITGLGSWYSLATSRRGRTTFGVAGLPIADLADFLVSYLQGEEPKVPHPEMTPAAFLKLATEDIKAYYMEAVGAQPGMASSRQLYNWFWDRTEAGACFLALQQHCLQQDDAELQRLAKVLLVPSVQRERLAAN